MENWQEYGEFSPEGRADALEIIRRLDGYPLAVEVAAVYLSEFPRRHGDFLRQLRMSGIQGLEDQTRLSERGLAIPREKRLSATLKPMLDTLRPDERQAVALAALPG